MDNSPTTTDLHPFAGFSLALQEHPSPALLVQNAPLLSVSQLFAEDLRQVLRDPANAVLGREIGFLALDLAGDRRVAALRERNIGLTGVCLFSGKLGEEWNRLQGYAPTERPVLLECWHGDGLVYLQTPVAPEVHDTVYRRVAPGDRIVVPPGWAALVANLGETPLLLGEALALSEEAPDYSGSDTLLDLQGFAHYILGDAPGTFSWDLNNHYRSVPVPREAARPDLEPLGLTVGTPFVTAFQTQPSSFAWLTAPAGAGVELSELYREEGW